MYEILAIAVAAAAGAGLGCWQRRRLATLRYRAEDEVALPDPGPRWWVVWAGMLAVGGLAAAAVFSADPVSRLGLAPLAVSGPWLAAVDADVMRLPNRVLGGTALLMAGAILTVAWVGAGPDAAIQTLIGAAAGGGLFAVIHFASRGELGFGDVKLAAIIGAGLGPLGLGHVCVALLAGSAAALIWIKATKHTDRHLPYGPWLLVGAWIAALMPSLTR